MAGRQERKNGRARGFRHLLRHRAAVEAAPGAVGDRAARQWPRAVPELRLHKYISWNLQPRDAGAAADWRSGAEWPGTVQHDGRSVRATGAGAESSHRAGT